MLHQKQNANGDKDVSSEVKVVKHYERTENATLAAVPYDDENGISNDSGSGSPDDIGQFVDPRQSPPVDLITGSTADHGHSEHALHNTTTAADEEARGASNGSTKRYDRFGADGEWERSSQGPVELAENAARAGDPVCGEERSNLAEAWSKHTNEQRRSGCDNIYEQIGDGCCKRRRLGSGGLQSTGRLDFDPSWFNESSTQLNVRDTGGLTQRLNEAHADPTNSNGNNNSSFPTPDESSGNQSAIPEEAEGRNCVFSTMDHHSHSAIQPGCPENEFCPAQHANNENLSFSHPIDYTSMIYMVPPSGDLNDETICGLQAELDDVRKENIDIISELYNHDSNTFIVNSRHQSPQESVATDGGMCYTGMAAALAAGFNGSKLNGTQSAKCQSTRSPLLQDSADINAYMRNAQWQPNYHSIGPMLQSSALSERPAPRRTGGNEQFADCSSCRREEKHSNQYTDISNHFVCNGLTNKWLITGAGQAGRVHGCPDFQKDLMRCPLEICKQIVQQHLHQQNDDGPHESTCLLSINSGNNIPGNDQRLHGSSPSLCSQPTSSPSKRSLQDFLVKSSVGGNARCKPLANSNQDYDVEVVGRKRQFTVSASSSDREQGRLLVSSRATTLGCRPQLILSREGPVCKEHKKCGLGANISGRLNTTHLRGSNNCLADDLGSCSVDFDKRAILQGVSSTPDTNRASSESENCVITGISDDSHDHNTLARIERKRQRNRIAARKCRTKKLERIAELEIRVRELTEKNERLENEAMQLKVQIFHLREMIGQHSQGNSDQCGLMPSLTGFDE